MKYEITVKPRAKQDQGNRRKRDVRDEVGNTLRREPEAPGLPIYHDNGLPAGYYRPENWGWRDDHWKR